MTQVTKYKLFPDEEFDFDLIGICSSHGDYRLCWNINQCLQISLTKGEDYSLVNKKDGESFHSFYYYKNEEDHTEYYLIKNVSNTYKHLIPEKDQVDYFLVIKNNILHDLDEVLNLLKTNESILTAFIFEPDELKSRSNLLF